MFLQTSSKFEITGCDLSSEDSSSEICYETVISRARTIKLQCIKYSYTCIFLDCTAFFWMSRHFLWQVRCSRKSYRPPAVLSLPKLVLGQHQRRAQLLGVSGNPGVTSSKTSGVLPASPNPFCRSELGKRGNGVRHKSDDRVHAYIHTIFKNKVMTMELSTTYLRYPTTFQFVLYLAF